MPRVKGGYTTRRRRKAVLKMAKGYYGSKHTLYKTANEQVMRSLAYAYRDRKDRKRQFRKLWITRINAASMQHGMKYSRFMNGLAKAGIEVNRKMLAEMAVNDKEGFKNLVEVSKKGLEMETKKVEENVVTLTRGKKADQDAPLKKEAAKKETAKKETAKKETAKKETAKKEEAKPVTKTVVKKEAVVTEEKAPAKKSATPKKEAVTKAKNEHETLETVVKKGFPKQAKEVQYGTKQTVAAFETEAGAKVEIIINKEDSYCLPCLTVAQLRDLASYYELADTSDLKRDQLLAYINSYPNRRPGVQVQVSINGSKPACLECFTLAKLRDLAKIKGLDGYSTMKKAELLQYIIDYATGVL